MPEPNVVTQDAPVVPEGVAPDLAYKARLVDVLAGNTKTRSKLLALVKEYNPDIRIPEIDTPIEIRESVVKPLEDKVTKLEGQLADRDARENKRESVRQAVAAGLREDEVPEVEKVMTERGISDFNTATEFYSKVVKPAAAPRPAPHTTIQLPDMKGLFKNPTQWARNEAYKVLHELGGMRR